MNAFERFFYGPHGAARSYLFGKVFPLLLALDTWMLMIGHAGRYGMGGFNVAHFGLLDALLPTPVAGFYVGVLVLTGLLALVVALTGVRRSSGLALFALYTLSWSMSMLDSYQHHYLLSVLLLCFAFFPPVSAAELHPQPPAAPAPGEKAKPQHKRELERAAGAELWGWLYGGLVLVACVAYAFVDHGEHTWVAFFAFAAVVAIATVFYTPERLVPVLRSGFGFNLLGAAVSVVYLYTAIAKMDANWVDGHTIRKISSVEREFAALANLGQSLLGIERERFWGLFATFVIPQELFVGAAYLLAVSRDRAPRPWLSALCGVAFALSIALHVGAEAMGLEIGWFSAYMLLLACCFLLPLAAVDRLVTVFTWPARLIARQTADMGRAEPSRAGVLAFALGGGALLLAVGQLIDLPGAVPACAIAAAALVGFALLQLRRGRDPRLSIAACGIAGMAMWLAIAASPVRWDFYRYLGGDLTRRDEPEAALEAYQRGERYAPPGKSRADKIKQLREQLGR